MGANPSLFYSQPQNSTTAKGKNYDKQGSANTSITLRFPENCQKTPVHDTGKQKSKVMKVNGRKRKREGSLALSVFSSDSNLTLSCPRLCKSMVVYGCFQVEIFTFSNFNLGPPALRAGAIHRVVEIETLRPSFGLCFLTRHQFFKAPPWSCHGRSEDTAMAST